MPKSKTRRTNFRHRTTFEQLPCEIFFEIFDYLTAHHIFKSFFALNQHFRELVCNIPNVHLDLSRTKTKFFHSFSQIFPMENVVSIVLTSKKISLLETLFHSLEGTKKLRSLTLLNIPLCLFETRLSELLNPFKDQLIKLEIHFTDMQFTGTGAIAAQSFGHLLTEFPLLKCLTLQSSYGIDSITYMPVNLMNTSIVNLNISLRNLNRLIPLLYRFENLKVLTIVHNAIRMKCMMPPDSITSYRNRLQEKRSVDYRIKQLRHIHLYSHQSIFDKIEQLFQNIQPANLLTLRLIVSKSSLGRYLNTRREILSLNTRQLHDLIKRKFPSTIKRFSIDYEDIDDLSGIIINLERVKREFRQSTGLSQPWTIDCSFNKEQNNVSVLISLFSSE